MSVKVASRDRTSKLFAQLCTCATVDPMWPFRHRACEEKKSPRLIKRLIVGLIIGGAIGSIVGGKVLEKHNKEHGVKDEE